MRSASEFVLGLSDRSQAGKWGTRFLTSLIPGSQLSGSIARELDPVSRDIRNLKHSLKSKIPGLREQLEPRISAITGKPRLHGGSWGPDMLSPIYKSSAIGDLVAEDMLELDMGVGLPAWTIDGDPMWPSERTQITVDSGEEANRLIMEMRAMPGWSELSGAHKNKAIRLIYNRAKARSRDRLRAKRIGERAKVYEKRRLRNRAAASEIQREGVR
jgi:hypothetical protein